MSDKSKKRDPDERVAHMNRMFDKYVVPLLGFTLAVIMVFGVIVPAVRSCAAKNEPEKADIREYSSAEFYVRRSLMLDRMASDSDVFYSVFEQAGCLAEDTGGGGKTIYAELEGSDEILENVPDANGNKYSAVLSSDAYGKEKGSKNLTLMIYSGSLFLLIAEEEDGTYSALFRNDSFEAVPSETDCTSLLEKVPSGEWSRMLEEYRQWLTPLLRQAEDAL